MKLCDESLCGDLSALTARLERLEKAAAKGLAVPNSAAPAAPGCAADPGPSPGPRSTDPDRVPCPNSSCIFQTGAQG